MLARKISKYIQQLRNKYRVLRSFVPTKEAARSRSEDAIILFCLLKDGTYFINEFIDYYTEIGVDLFYFIDNNSCDSLLESVSKYDNVNVIHSDASFKDFECEMRRYAIEKYGLNHWCLCVDIDEFIDLPNLNTIKLNGLIKYLSANGYTGLICHMLDMFSSIDDNNLYKHEPFDRTNYSMYDVTDIEKVAYDQVAYAYWTRDNLNTAEHYIYFGGIRKKVFGTNNGLSKHCLFFVDGDSDLITHPHASNKLSIADITGVLYHYHFADGFIEKTKKYNNNLLANHNEHSVYYKKIAERPDLSFNTLDSKELSDVKHLVDESFLRTSRNYQNFCESINQN